MRQRPISHAGTPDGVTATVAPVTDSGSRWLSLYTRLSFTGLAVPELLVGILAFAVYLPIAAAY